jgi:hypothetical protein
VNTYHVSPCEEQFSDITYSMKMSHIWMACAVVSTLATLPSRADESSSAAAGQERSYTGTVTAVHPNEQTIRVRDLLFLNKEFHIGNTCTFDLWGNPSGALMDLRVGEAVTVSFQRSNGILVADKVRQEMATRVGVVTAIDPVARTMTVRDRGMNKPFQIAEDCKIVLRGDHSGLISDVQAGNLVTVTYDTPVGQPTVREIAQTSETFTGTLTAIDLDAKTLKAKSTFATKAFTMGDQCAIVVNGKMGGQLSDLTPNERLIVNYDNVDGVNVVSRIATVPAGQTETTVTTNQ